MTVKACATAAVKASKLLVFLVLFVAIFSSVRLPIGSPPLAAIRRRHLHDAAPARGFLFVRLSLYAEQTAILLSDRIFGALVQSRRC